MSNYVTAHEIELYAVNTQELYEDHKRLARRGVGLPRWQSYVRNHVWPLYQRQIEPNAIVRTTELHAAAAILRDYYREHVAECDA